MALADGRRVIETGIVSAFAEWCKVEWTRRNYLPFMRAERAKKLWSDRQLAYIGVLHGITVGFYAKQFAQGGSCPEERRKQIEFILARQR